jgi:hypothetical protein
MQVFSIEVTWNSTIPGKNWNTEHQTREFLCPQQNQKRDMFIQELKKDPRKRIYLRSIVTED